MLKYLAIASVVAAGCNSENEVLAPEGQQPQPAAALAQSCGSKGGVTVEATVEYSGSSIPSTATAYAYWQKPLPQMPSCIVQLHPVAFPAKLRFTDVANEGLPLAAIMLMKGQFPPVPQAGDYMAQIQPELIDLTKDASDIVLRLEPVLPDAGMPEGAADANAD